MLKFDVSEILLHRSIMGYLRRMKLYDTLCIYSLEKNMIELNESNDELLYVNELCLSGRWEDLLRYLQPLQEYLHEYQKLQYYIRKQQYLEALSWQSIIEPAPGIIPWRPRRHPSEYTSKESEEIMKVDMEKVVATLKTLEPLCSQREFNQLCNCLTYASLSEIPEFSSWTVSKGRLELFERMYSHLYTLFIEKKLVKPAEASNEIHEIVYPRKGLEDLIAMGLKGFLENFEEDKASNSRRKGQQETNRTISVAIHPSGLLLPMGCELLPSHHFKLPVLVQNGRPVTTDDIKNDKELEEHLSHPEEYSVDDKTDIDHVALPSASRNDDDDIPRESKDIDSTWAKPQEEDRFPSNVERGKKPKGTRWDINFETPEEKSSIRNRNLPPDDILRDDDTAAMSPFYSKMKSNSFELLDQKLPPPPKQNETVQTQKRSQHALPEEDHSIESIPTINQNRRKATIETKKNYEEKKSLPRWGQLPHGQSTLIHPVCVHRDSTPLRCVSMLTPPQQDVLEDSLGLVHPNSDKPYSLIAVGSNSKSITVLHYDHTERDAPGKVTIIDELSGVHNGSIYTLDWSNDGRFIASGSNDKYIRIISGHIPTGPFSVRAALKGHSGTVRTVKFSPHPAILASGGAGDCKMRVWDVNQAALLRDFTPHEDHIHVVEWISDTVVLSGCEQGQLLAHDIRTANPIWSIDISNDPNHHGICSLYRNPGTDLAIVGHSTGSFSLLDLRTHRILQSHSYHQSDIRSVLMWSESNPVTHRNDIFALTTSFDRTSIVWQLYPTPGSGVPFELIQQAKLIGHHDKILSCTYSKLTNDLFTSSADGTILCWSPNNVKNHGNNHHEKAEKHEIDSYQRRHIGVEGGGRGNGPSRGGGSVGRGGRVKNSDDGEHGGEIESIQSGGSGGYSLVSSHKGGKGGGDGYDKRVKNISSLSENYRRK